MLFGTFSDCVWPKDVRDIARFRSGGISLHSTYVIVITGRRPSRSLVRFYVRRDIAILPRLQNTLTAAPCGIVFYGGPRL